MERTALILKLCYIHFNEDVKAILRTGSLPYM